jgi:hypothetical protein
VSGNIISWQLMQYLLTHRCLGLLRGTAIFLLVQFTNDSSMEPNSCISEWNAGLLSIDARYSEDAGQHAQPNSLPYTHSRQRIAACLFVAVSIQIPCYKTTTKSLVRYSSQLLGLVGTLICTPMSRSRLPRLKQHSKLDRWIWMPFSDA